MQFLDGSSLGGGEMEFLLHPDELVDLGRALRRSEQNVRQPECEGGG
jgi:hypothetical protein